uniref:ARM repeat superfamily protein n=1 Tax=Zea mays TaxID=4577 RepID=B7ZYF9_MAIZE|nr:unknown [Zea mays]
MGKALRKETRVEKWEKAISNLSTYATCAPGPVSYVNEKDVETTLTIFGSFEFSLEAMPENSRIFFMALAAISWEEPVPEACLESIWSALEQCGLFSLVVSKLVEGSLIIKLEDQPLYHMHDMVSLYLENKTNDATRALLSDSISYNVALVAPWLFVFGKECMKRPAEQKMGSFFSLLEFMDIEILLVNTTQALMACRSLSELETNRIGFSKILGPRIAEIISIGSLDLIFAVTAAITVIFSPSDYINLAHSLEIAGSIDKLIDLLGACEDTSTLANLSSVLTKISEHVDATIADEILSRIPMVRIADLLTAENEQWHEIVFTTLASLTKVGKLKAVETMIESGIDNKLLVLLGNGSEISQHHAIITLKTFCELGAPLQGCIGPAVLLHLPWHARISLERFVLSDRNVPQSPKPQQSFEVILHNILLLGSHLFDRLAWLLQRREVEKNQVRSQTAFLVMKLACTGGEPYVHRFLELNIVHELIDMLQCNIDELQDSAYYALHQIVFAKGGSLVLQRFLQLRTIEKLVNLLDRKSLKTKDLAMQFLVDITEVGTKPCIERMLASQIVEKLVALEKAGDPFGGAVSRYIQGLNMCKKLQSAERAVMKQHILRKVRSAVRGHKLEAILVASVEASIAEG